MQVHSFLDPASETFSHILVDTRHKKCAIIDPVLDFDVASARTSTAQADKLIAFVEEHGLSVTHLIETHAHADHLSAAVYLQEKLGGQTVIGTAIRQVQKTFGEIYHLGAEFRTDASQFDLLTEDGTQFFVGDIQLTAISVAGHTPADMAYVASIDTQSPIIFVGDTLFAPDVGTARCDFPNGSAHDLYDAIGKLLQYPDDTRLYLCHDYPPAASQRSHQAYTTVGETRRHNIHVKDGISKDEFIAMRTTRDQSLPMPRLMLPAVQVNINAGQLPAAQDNGVRYLKLPLNVF
ncbi:MBL fold metallo-hydrolase [Moraxella caviae]|uniref:MBL fold metallo-hydrolase n=1 Tax=Moraxella caviae TaxID=34060 RepID=A0A1T0AAP4_9GAMM|nr:MBL fold metallo-hydrolase [Moraxella caviae]OOR92797.1 MBL fold metallo-hydrolase [Moraxella caviae]STZ14166.1 Probable polyketide biosynthesis zinc-dependent hydrolase BaeB [Moraxella caviae]VEW12612.1 Probable polyketide biosynthesis zinc-dependent hydrolase BaeB [Moraxella caviae]